MSDLESLARGNPADHSTYCACPDPARVEAVRILDAQVEAGTNSKDCACPEPAVVGELGVEEDCMQSQPTTPSPVAGEEWLGSGAGFEVEVVVPEL